MQREAKKVIKMVLQKYSYHKNAKRFEVGQENKETKIESSHTPSNVESWFLKISGEMSTKSYGLP